MNTAILKFGIANGPDAGRFYTGAIGEVPAMYLAPRGTPPERIEATRAVVSSYFADPAATGLVLELVTWTVTIDRA